jgi:hypothetical protein
MAQALVNKLTMETIGASSNFTQVYVDVVVMEVLGYFKFGTVDIDELITEVLGKSTSTSQCNIGVVTSEVIGQWAGF